MSCQGCERAARPHDNLTTALVARRQKLLPLHQPGVIRGSATASQRSIAADLQASAVSIGGIDHGTMVVDTVGGSTVGGALTRAASAVRPNIPFSGPAAVVYFEKVCCTVSLSLPRVGGPSAELRDPAGKLIDAEFFDESGRGGGRSPVARPIGAISCVAGWGPEFHINWYRACVTMNFCFFSVSRCLPGGFSVTYWGFSGL